MEVMKSKLRMLVPALVLAVVLSASVVVPAFATSASFGGNLTPWQGNITLQTGQKGSTASTSANVTVYSANSGGVFWIDRSSTSTRATDSGTINPGQYATLAYYNYNTWTGTVLLRGCEIGWGPATDYTTGYVNFG